MCRRSEFGRGIKRARLQARASDGLEQRVAELLTPWIRAKQSKAFKLEELDEPQLLTYDEWRADDSVLDDAAEQNFEQARKTLFMPLPASLLFLSPLPCRCCSCSSSGARYL